MSPGAVGKLDDGLTGKLDEHGALLPPSTERSDEHGALLPPRDRENAGQSGIGGTNVAQPYGRRREERFPAPRMAFQAMAAAQEAGARRAKRSTDSRVDGRRPTPSSSFLVARLSRSARTSTSSLVSSSISSSWATRRATREMGKTHKKVSGGARILQDLDGNRAAPVGTREEALARQVRRESRASRPGREARKTRTRETGAQPPVVLTTPLSNVWNGSSCEGDKVPAFRVGFALVVFQLSFALLSIMNWIICMQSPSLL